jgi:hypothetical protein
MFLLLSAVGHRGKPSDGAELLTSKALPGYLGIVRCLIDGTHRIDFLRRCSESSRMMGIAARFDESVQIKSRKFVMRSLNEVESIPVEIISENKVEPLHGFELGSAFRGRGKSVEPVTGQLLIRDLH